MTVRDYPTLAYFLDCYWNQTEALVSDFSAAIRAFTADEPLPERAKLLDELRSVGSTSFVVEKPAWDDPSYKAFWDCDAVFDLTDLADGISILEGV